MNAATLQSIRNNFTTELELSAKGEKTSLAFIKNTIPSSPLVKNGEIFQTMAIGGTNFKSGLMKKTAEGIEILEVKDKVQPPIFETKEEFLSFLQENLAPDVTILSLNLAFPIEPVFANGKLEGILLFATKEHEFAGLIGQNVCTEVEKYLLQKLGRKLQVSIANDTVCLLLSGKTQVQDTYLAAGVVGTGFNFAFFLDPTTAVNTESGGFDKFPQTSSGKAIDNESIIKGKFLFEKEIAGAYLYKHFNTLARERGIAAPELINSKQLTNIAEKEDSSDICLLAKKVLQNSAEYAASSIAGITSYMQHDMTFVMLGSLFWKGDGYKGFVEDALKQLVPEYKITFLNVDHSDLLGAAKLVA